MLCAQGQSGRAYCLPDDSQPNTRPVNPASLSVPTLGEMLMWTREIVTKSLSSLKIPLILGLLFILGMGTADAQQGVSDFLFAKDGTLDDGGDGIPNPGDLINYNFGITNTSSADLFNVTVSDPMVSPITCPSGNPIPTLASGASESCTGSYAITQADIDAGVKNNTATASTADPPLSDDGSHSETIPQNEALAFTKTGVLDLGADGTATPGDIATYTFEVTNTGTTSINNLAITDPQVTPITCPSGNPIPTLAPSASESCTGTYAITQADIDAGFKDNTATATSSDIAARVAPVQAMNRLPITQGPTIKLDKTGTLDLGADGTPTVGDLISYSFVVTNPGNVTLTNITVSDPLVPTITCPSGNPIPTLTPGASETCTGSYAITQADIDARHRDNTATASGQDPIPQTITDQDNDSRPIPAAVPFLNHLGLLSLGLLLIGAGALTLRRRRSGPGWSLN